MWPFTRKPREPRFKVGDTVYFSINEGSRLFPGTIREIDMNHRRPYVVQADGIDTCADIEESLIRARSPQEISRG